MRLFCVSEQVFRLGYPFGLGSIIKYCGRSTVLSIKINWRARSEQPQPGLNSLSHSDTETSSRQRCFVTEKLVAIKKCKKFYIRILYKDNIICSDDSFSAEKSVASAWSCHIKESWQCFPSSRLTEQTCGDLNCQQSGTAAKINDKQSRQHVGPL